MTILVTGGAGFIGANYIMDWLRLTDERVVNVDKLTYAGNLESLESIFDDPHHIFVNGDILDAELMDSTLQEHTPRAIINFAAESHVDRSIHGASDFIQTNIVGTYTLLESALKYWKLISSSEKETFRFLHVSTDEVYGSLGRNDPPFSETNQYKPNSPYSASKASSDHLVRAFYQTHGLPVLTTNCSNNYGPYQFPEKLIPLIIHNAISGEKLPIYGDGKQIRDWLYVLDHCSAIRTVLSKGVVGEMYNIGGKNEMENISVVKVLCDILDVLQPKTDGTSYQDQITFVEDRLGHDRRYAIDSTKIEKELGWNPSATFESGIQLTVQWYLENQTWVEHTTSGSYRNWIKKNYSTESTT